MTPELVATTTTRCSDWATVVFERCYQCASCGRWTTEKRWCSDSCHRADEPTAYEHTDELGRIVEMTIDLHEAEKLARGMFTVATSTINGERFGR